MCLDFCPRVKYLEHGILSVVVLNFVQDIFEVLAPYGRKDHEGHWKDTAREKAKLREQV